ncbi:hypothetical protein FJR11_15715 [Anabaena sp. UHCC 0187]|uniref:hypothetical protein n=1 Tax=Anabaena sp. UHCC 0187 TaxID=2590018 RepID=UPI0014451BED|nr:hypothetical protein [Anabaena sp. UHCC 0187]MTJ14002.1 hypothetical protein [Anabaena sp. UHCC 0187]
MKILDSQVLLGFLSLILGVTTPIVTNSSIAFGESTPKYAQSISNQQPIVNKTEFGVRIINSEGKVNFFPTTTVPLKQGDAYGWKIKLDNYQGKVKWREVLTLPQAPETWTTQDNKNFSISADGKTAISKRIETPVNGVIENFWTVSPGDPLGKHQVKVYIDERLIATFDFEIVPF